MTRHSVGDPGACHEVTHNATWLQPAELCDADTHPQAYYCPAHGGPQPDDDDFDPDTLDNRP